MSRIGKGEVSGVMDFRFRDLLDIDISECPHAVYRYKFLADKIGELTLAGELPTNAPFPNERDLASALKVSVGTVRKVMGELRDRGVVVTVPSKGSFVVAADKRPANHPDESPTVPHETREIR